MKVAFLAAAVVALARADVEVSLSKLQSFSKVEYDFVACGEWSSYRCCSSKSDCDKITKDDTSKRKKNCVPTSESCCGADITYKKSKGTVTHDDGSNKNVKGCKSGEVCTIEKVLESSDGRKHLGSFNTKDDLFDAMGNNKKRSSECMKTSKYEKIAGTAQKKGLKKEVTIDFDDLRTSSKVEYNEVQCGEWKDYICCSKASECDKLKKEDGKSKKDDKKHRRERDRNCVPKDETCCGADISYNWKHNDAPNGNLLGVEHNQDPGKNNKGCDKDEVCVVSHLLNHADNLNKKNKGHHVTGFATKQLIGSSTKTSCMKKTSYDKKAEKRTDKAIKEEHYENIKAVKEFIKDTSISAIYDGSHACGNFDKSFKCCSPDKHFCDSISAANKDKYCAKKEDDCCADFEYAPNDRSMIKLVEDVSKSACDHDSAFDHCVVEDHIGSDRKVKTTCVEKKVVESNKYRKKKKGGGGDSTTSDILQIFG